MTDQPSPTAAELNAQAARRQLASTVATVQARLAPAALAHEIVQTLRGKQQDVVRDGIDTARRYPLQLAAAGTAIGLFLARRSIARLFARRKPDATPLPATSLTLDNSPHKRLRAGRRKSS